MLSSSRGTRFPSGALQGRATGPRAADNPATPSARSVALTGSYLARASPAGWALLAATAVVRPQASSQLVHAVARLLQIASGATGAALVLAGAGARGVLTVGPWSGLSDRDGCRMMV